MLARQPGRHRPTLGADKGYYTTDFVAQARGLNITPHVAQHTSRRSALDGRTTSEAFGWIKTTGGLRKTRHRGAARVGWIFTLTAVACNLVRLPKLLEAT